MGCVSSKRARSPSPVRDSTANSSVRHHHGSEVRFDSSLSKQGGSGFGDLEKIKEEPEKENEEESVGNSGRELKNSKSSKKGAYEKKAVFSLRLGRYTEAEQISAGWPPWLSAVAGEAVQGWLPLRADLYEKLDKVGQGTYSSVYRARDVETGRLVALKKVRFDNFQPESVRFMAREITILRRLDHPNIMKLEGLITNRFSCSIYLVFEYMEHDLSGLLSCPDVNFSDSQIKCYMRQLLAGLEHCHFQGVMHRDIKTSNILINNEGILKIADFGLANYVSSRHRRPLTSRVVTLWYRPPELLLGSTNYGSSVDLWSVGCVFAELFTGKPILKGRTEVEQLHKIFKLCGSPPDDYWRKSKLPLATVFKPQYPYPSSLRERCKELPKSAVNLLETFLSIEPHKRGTASSALNAEYFSTKPYACDPSSLPKYKPYKEFDAKVHEEMRRRKVGVRARVSGTSRNPRRGRRASQEEFETTTRFAHRNNGGNAHVLKTKGAAESRESLNSSYDSVCEASQATEVPQVDSFRSVPVITASSNFEWARKRKGYAVPSRLPRQASSRSRSQSFSSLDPSSILQASHTLDSDEHENDKFSSKVSINSGGNELYGVPKHASRQKNRHLQRPDSFDASDLYRSMDLSGDQKGVQFSGPESHRLGGEQENHIRQAGRGSQFHRGGRNSVI